MSENGAPTVDGGTIHLPGVGPRCPGCGGPTFSVTGDPNAARPWWCGECNVRLDGDGEPGAHASFPADSQDNSESDR